MKKLVMSLLMAAFSLTAVSVNAIPLSDKMMPQMQKTMHTVDINHADKKALMSLPGIGESKAEAIIDYREHNGMFKNAHDLTKVKGIGEATAKKLAPMVKI